MKIILDEKVYNANKMKEVAESLADRMKSIPDTAISLSEYNGLDLIPDKRPISEYDNIIQNL